MTTSHIQDYRRDLSSRTVAKWSELKQLRDEVRMKARQHAENASQGNHINPTLEDDNLSGQNRFDIDQDKTTFPPALQPQPLDSTEGAAIATQSTEDPVESAASSCCKNAPGAVKHVRFAAQLEEPPPAAPHSPCRTAAGGRGAYASRMLRAISLPFAKALRRAPG
jgi:hypothetical protein